MTTPSAAEHPDHRALFRARLSAAGVHLLASGVIALGVAGVVFPLWFPGAYRVFSGGTSLFLMIVGIDLVMGPLMTLLIFDRRKPVAMLRRDVIVVALLQLGALGFGLHTLAYARPVVMALEVDRFRVVSAVDVRSAELPQALPEFRSLSLTGPRLVIGEVPKNSEHTFEAVKLALEGYDVGTRPSLWHPWDAGARQQALQQAHPLRDLPLKSEAESQVLADAVHQLGRQPESLVYLPVITFRGDWIALLDAASGEFEGFAALNGFPDH